jgi:hypothetical protein
MRKYLAASLVYAVMLFVSADQSFSWTHRQPYTGPGSPGFLPTCAAWFTVGATPTLGNCPAGVAFRHWSPLTISLSNPVIAFNTQSYNSASNNTYVRPWSLVDGSYYGFVSVSADSGATYPALALYTTANPLLGWTTPASALIDNVANTWINNMLLHAELAPRSCSRGTYCVYLSASKPNSGPYSIGLFSASTITGPYTPYARNPVIPDTIQCNGESQNMLPNIIQIGGNLVMYTAHSAFTGKSINYWTSPVGDGVNWTCGGVALYAPTVNDWDYPNLYGTIDPFVWLNKHGFYEMVYTVETSGSVQKFGYAVSADGFTWYRYANGPIVMASAIGCPSADNVGDPTVFISGSTLQISGDCTAGVNAATMNNY